MGNFLGCLQRAAPQGVLRMDPILGPLCPFFRPFGASLLMLGSSAVETGICEEWDNDKHPAA
jgi:hypothetical protein